MQYLPCSWAAAGLLLAALLGAPAAQAGGASRSLAAAEAGPNPSRAGAPGQTKSARKGVPRRQVGKASFYAPKFHGRTMADGTPMDPRDDNAASRTLPLGTKARVTNLETGRSAVVTIQDRGPYVDGRIVDLSPASAEQIGLTPRQGLAPVEVVPLQLPAKGDEGTSVAEAR